MHPLCFCPFLAFPSCYSSLSFISSKEILIQSHLLISLKIFNSFTPLSIKLSSPTLIKSLLVHLLFFTCSRLSWSPSSSAPFPYYFPCLLQLHPLLPIFLYLFSQKPLSLKPCSLPSFFLLILLNSPTLILSCFFTTTSPKSYSFSSHALPKFLPILNISSTHIFL